MNLTTAKKVLEKSNLDLLLGGKQKEAVLFLLSLSEKLTEEKLINLMVNTMNKEAIRNSQPQGHTYSVYCSCGRCHRASLLTQAILTEITGERK